MPDAPLVVSESLGKRYRRNDVLRAALEDVTFEIAGGTFAVVVGKSGSGKTTLLNLIGGLDRPTSGDVRVEGRSLRALRDRELSRYRNERVGFVFQSFNLRPHDSALENVLTPFLFAHGRHRDAKQRACAALAAVGLGEMVDQTANTLSAGQRQRVAVARAIVRDPVLLLADEPTGNLDAETGSEVIGLLKGLNHEKHVTVVVATHDPELTAAAGFVLTLRDGRQVDGEA